MTRLIDDFDAAEESVERAAIAWSMPALALARAGMDAMGLREAARRSVDRLEGHLPLLERSKPMPAPPQDLIAIAVATQRFHVSAKTIQRAVKSGRLRDHRPMGHAPNSPLLVEAACVARLWPPKLGQSGGASGHSADKRS